MPSFLVSYSALFSSYQYIPLLSDFLARIHSSEKPSLSIKPRETTFYNLPFVLWDKPFLTCFLEEISTEKFPQSPSTPWYLESTKIFLT